jgi:hypothetical protein
MPVINIGGMEIKNFSCCRPYHIQVPDKRTSLATGYDARRGQELV